MFSISFKRVWRAGWTNLKRESSPTAAAIFVMVMAILLITFLFVFRQVSDYVISELREKVDISVYFKENAEPVMISEIQEELSHLPEVSRVEYVSSETALENFIQKHKEDQVLMESLKEIGENPLLASLNIKAKEASQYQAIAGFLQDAPFNDLIAKIDFQERKPVIERIYSLAGTVNKIGIILFFSLLLVAFLVVFNQIRLAIYHSRKEISIQNLVGADNWFLQGPFLVQGAVSGFFAGLICFFIFSLTFLIFNQKIAILFPGVNVWHWFAANFFWIFLIQISTGIGLGVISSLVAIRKYLKAQ